MWWWGWWGGVLAGAALLLALRRRGRAHHAPLAPHAPRVHIVSDHAPSWVRRPRRARPPHPAPAPPRPPLQLPPLEKWLPQQLYKHNFALTIPRPLAQHASCDLSSEQDTALKTLSITRSPSLERDDKSPFVIHNCGNSFKFEADNCVMIKVDSENNSLLEKGSEDITMQGAYQEKPQGNIISKIEPIDVKVNLSSVREVLPSSDSECLDKSSPLKTTECDSVISSPKFAFSPKLLSGSLSSPKFFTPPETISPLFFTDKSPISVYYDSSKSPKFFSDSMRDADVPQSPKAFSDNQIRITEKPTSPKVPSARPSPKKNSYNKENYFTFDLFDTNASKSCKSKRCTGRSSLEKSTPQSEKDSKKFKRYNSYDSNFSNTESNQKEPTTNIAAKPVNSNETSIGIDDCTNRINDLQIKVNSQHTDPVTENSKTAHERRKRLKSISLDSDNAKIIEQNLSLPIAKELKDQASTYLNSAEWCESVGPLTVYDSQEYLSRYTLGRTSKEDSPKSPTMKPKGELRQSCNMSSFLDFPRFSPKELEIIDTNSKIDTSPIYDIDSQSKKKLKNLHNLTIDLNKRDVELEKELLEFDQLYSGAEDKKVKTPTLKVKATSLDSSDAGHLSLPQNNILEVPLNSMSFPNTPKRQTTLKAQAKNYESIRTSYSSTQSEQCRLLLKSQDSGIFLRENHANLMLFLPDQSTACPFEEGISNSSNVTLKKKISNLKIRSTLHTDSSLLHTSNITSHKNSISLSNTNLKTLPEGIPSDDFKIVSEEEDNSKNQLQLNPNQSIRTKLPQESKEVSVQESCSRSISFTGSGNKMCLLQRRGSNNSLSLNIQPPCLSRYASNASLKAAKTGSKKGLLERRSSNTSLTLNITTSNPQLFMDRGLATSSSNLNESMSNLSKYQSQQSIDNDERRTSNTSLTLNIKHQDVTDSAFNDELQQSYRKSQSSENLVRNPYKNRLSLHATTSHVGFGSEDSLSAEASSFVRNISTQPLSPLSTSADFRAYLANMHHLQSASHVLSRQQLRDLDDIFRRGYSARACEPDACECGETGAADKCASYQKALIRSLHKEFWELPTNFQEKPLVSGSHAKNRYRSILPNEHSRVLLRAPPPTDGYINANLIQGQEFTQTNYIATQGPLPNTTFDFWLMVHQSYGAWRAAGGGAQPQLIVMLTDLVEGNRSKCERYFPLEEGARDAFACPADPAFVLSVRCERVERRAAYSVRWLRLTAGESQPVPVVHYWFPGWPDHACPEAGDAVEALLELALAAEAPGGPPRVVHCSAGVGRTGCLVATAWCARQLRAAGRADVLGAVCALRLARGGLVQTSEQYLLVHRLLAAFQRSLPPD